LAYKTIRHENLAANLLDIEHPQDVRYRYLREIITKHLLIYYADHILREITVMDCSEFVNEINFYEDL
jgi:hypothetical protein